MNTFSFNIGTRKTSVVSGEGFDLMTGREQGKSLSVYDENTFRLYPNHKGRHVVLEAGEQYKSWESVRKILDSAIDEGLGRDDTIVGIGGGVICDMAAFAASIYMRGCRLVLVPTTLLSMIDASLGGKTAIDYNGLKNMAGTFYPAEEIRILPDTLKTLSDKEFLNGLGEVIKHALLGDKELYSMLKSEMDGILSRDQELLTEIIERSLLVKGKIVEADPIESGIRANLNFGHTFAHALEGVSGFKKWSHGEAVAWGIDKALKTGVLIGQTDSEYAAEVETLLSDYGFKLTAPDISASKMLEIMKSDKKKRAGEVRFVLQRKICDTFLTPVDDEILGTILQR